MNLLFNPPTSNCTVLPILTKEKYYAPKVLIELNALLKMKAFIDAATEEIAWLGLVEQNENVYTIKDVKLVKQKTTATTAEIDEEGLQEFAEELIASGKEDELGNIRMWGHSHVEMSVTPSGQDDSTFKEYYQKCPYFIRLIGNKKGEMRIDIALTAEKAEFDNVQYEIAYPTNLQPINEKISKLNSEIETLTKTINDSVTQIYDAELTQAKVFVEELKPKYQYTGYGYPSSYSQTKTQSKEEKEEEVDDDYNTKIYYGHCFVNSEWKMVWKQIDEVFTEPQIRAIAGKTSEEAVKKYVELIKYAFPTEEYDERDWLDLWDAATYWVYMTDEKEQEILKTYQQEYDMYGYNIYEDEYGYM